MATTPPPTNPKPQPQATESGTLGLPATLTATGEVAQREGQILDTFVELADTLVEDFDLVDFLCGLTERVVALHIASEVGILLTDERGMLQFVAASHERTQMLELFQVEHDEGPCQDCFATGQPINVPDLSDTDERWPLFRSKALALGFRSVQAVPLRLRGEILGAMNLFLNEPGGISSQDLAMVQAMADIATIGILQQRELHRAHTVESQLQSALQSRIGIEQAKGIVAEQATIDPDAAFERLRRHARSHNRKLADVARDIVKGTAVAADLNT